MRDLSDAGAQVVLGDASPVVGQVAFSLVRETGHIRQAEVVWQRDERLGLRFSAGATTCDDEVDRLWGDRKP